MMEESLGSGLAARNTRVYTVGSPALSSDCTSWPLLITVATFVLTLTSLLVY